MAACDEMISDGMSWLLFATGDAHPLVPGEKAELDRFGRHRAKAGGSCTQLAGPVALAIVLQTKGS